MKYVRVPHYNISLFALITTWLLIQMPMNLTALGSQAFL